MAKKKQPSPPPEDSPMDAMVGELQKSIPADAQKKLDELKGKLETFKKQVLDKFDEYVMGIALLPPKDVEKERAIVKETEQRDLSHKEMEQLKNQVNVLVLIDDSDSKKLTKEELKQKLSGIIADIAQKVDPNLAPETLILTELWQYCYDAKYDYLQLLSISAPIHDKGMLAAIKIAEIHKSMVLKKFEKYIVSYVLAGSLVQGTATPQSDIDVFIVIDDTDVKRMTRVELKDKLRAIIIGMGLDAGKMTGIENKLNIQVYILTDFWDNIKEANPIIFTFLRDGVPFYDRGIFMPWKQLLQMGRIKPSPEAIDMFMNSGGQIMERVGFKLRDIAMEDIFYALLTPTQAALMLYGVPPPTPKETPHVARNTFVKKAKLLEDTYIKILENVINTRKQLEHGSKKKISGKELDKLLLDAEKYLKRLSDLFKEISDVKEKQSVVTTYENVVTVIRDILRLEGIEKVGDKDIVIHFQKEMVHKGLIPEKYLRVLKEIVKAKKDYDADRLSREDVMAVNKKSNDLIKFMVEYMQRKRGRELERAKIRIKHGKHFGEVVLLDKTAFIIHDIDAEDKDISKAEVAEDGSITNIQESSIEEYEQALSKKHLPAKAFIKEPLFENLKGIFGKDVEILIYH